jgi:hypothetical protein
MTVDSLLNLEVAVEALLAREPTVTPDRVRSLIAACRALPMCDASDEEAELLARRFEVRHGVTMLIGSVLTERNYKPWLESALKDIDFYYWGRYKRLLGSKRLSRDVIGTVHEDTDRILGLLENPNKEGAWDRRGMVVGHVQSGKTANYIGLMCKAADSGYRLIVVIAGVHNSLRNQTQKRVDEGFVGRDSARLLSQHEEATIGVGRFDQTRRPVTFTNSVKDFNRVMATGIGVPLRNLTEPAVFVIKKNSTTLKNLLDWLHEHNAAQNVKTVDVPMLLIDDEADNASINVSHGRNEVSKINGQIRELLHMFSRSCYVGYTATPFANIFIDPDTDDEMRGEDLFPRHFIMSLDPPSNYFGATRVFREDSARIVRHIEDNESLLPLSHKIDFVVTELPGSLASAVRAFVVARTIRLLRGHLTEHCSMLVNASRFTGVQRQLRVAIQELLVGIQASVKVNGQLTVARARADPEIAALQRAWESEFKDTGVPWAAVQERLLEAAAPIKVVEVNSRSAGTLNYDDYKDTGLNVIAVGGFALSRGLTLEGLMVTYFLRNSMMYDTLLQMGRWFGYRDDYDDLCRLWMSAQAEGWYAHVADSIEMLRDELREMAKAGATPEEFGLKVRAHPDTLIVTARNKMGSGETVVVNIGLGKQFVETATLRNDEGSLRRNRQALEGLVRGLGQADHPITNAVSEARGWLLSAAPVAPILKFLTAFKNHPLSMMTEPGPISRYIEERRATELANWDILFASLQNSDDDKPDNSTGLAINCQRRTAGRRSDRDTMRITDSQRVASRGVERTGLTALDIEHVEAEYRASHPRPTTDTRTWNYPDHIYRERRPRPLLIIHLLRVDDPQTKAPLHREPVVAWSISFPATQHPEQRVEYVVNTTWLREQYRDELDDVDEADMGGDID